MSQVMSSSSLTVVWDMSVAPVFGSSLVGKVVVKVSIACIPPEVIFIAVAAPAVFVTDPVQAILDPETDPLVTVRGALKIAPMSVF